VPERVVAVEADQFDVHSRILHEAANSGQESGYAWRRVLHYQFRGDSMRNASRFFLRAAALPLGFAPMLALAQTCTGLCLQQVTCPNPAVTTTISGKVYAPNGTDPLPGVLVYVPNAPVQALSAGASCRNGGTPPTSPLVQAMTGIDGSFTVANMPVGANIPLVIQSGKWRRQIVIPSVIQCTNTAIANSSTRFPKNKTEGDIPQIAVVTGNGDAAECIFRKIGIDDAEVSASSSAGRIHLFTGAGNAGAKASGSASETALEASSATLGAYDMVMLACQGNAYPQSLAAQQNLVDYANVGGRVMAAHYEYTWLNNVAPFSGTASWHVQQSPTPADQTGYIDQSTTDGLQLAQWLQIVGATTTLGQIPLQALHHDFDGVIPPSQSWLSVNDVNFGNMSVQYSFGTPVGTAPTKQCGRVQYMDYHVESTGNTTSLVFPAECSAGAMTPQEKLLEYLVFDLTKNLEPPLFADGFEGP